MRSLFPKIKRGKTKNDIGDDDSIGFPGWMLVFGWSKSTVHGRSLSFKVIDGFPRDLNEAGGVQYLFLKKELMHFQIEKFI